MKARIFKTTLYIILLLACIQGIAVAQDAQTQKEKDLETKLKALEQKMDAMQTKMDSMKSTQKRTVTIRRAAPATSYNATPAVPAPPAAVGAKKVAPHVSVRGYSSSGMGSDFKFDEKFDKAFKSLDKLDFSSFDKNLEERIKSGELKELTKTYTKSYNVDRNDVLLIDNKYGKVTVNTWNKNEFKVDVQIKADANEQDEAQKLLDNVSISDSKEGSNVSFQTEIKGSKTTWNMWSGDGKTALGKLEINYTIYMPSKNALTITNRYGGTTLPDFDGKLTINSSYGSFVAKALTNPANNITSRYGSTNIESLKGSDLKVAYGSLLLGSCDNITADVSYSSAKISSIKTSGNINMRYGGGLKIGELDKNFKDLLVNSSYSSVQLGLGNGQNFNFDVTVHYGGFSYGDHNVTVTDKTPSDDEHGWTSTKTYKGHMGKGNSDKTITIKTNYGSVKFD
jgi:hypothetical protein